MPVRHSQFAVAQANDIDDLSWSETSPAERTGRGVWLGTMAFWLVVAGLIAARIMFLGPAHSQSASTECSVEISAPAKL